MAPQTRRASFPKVVIERDSDSEPSSSEEEEGEEDEVNREEEEAERGENEEGEEEEALENKNGERKAEGLDAKKKGKAPITLSLKKVCKVKAYPTRCSNSVLIPHFVHCFDLFFLLVVFQVCKKAGHEAGFKGATYIDCPMKPCFLCKMPGMF